MELKRVLVVDDNTVNLATVENALKGKYEVIPMISGKRALKFLYCNKVDIILLDVEMPEMDGVETLENIRNVEACADTPVVFLTAKKDKQTVLDGFRLKIMDYVIKPFNVDDLIERVEKTLKRTGRLPYEKKELVKVFGPIVKALEDGDIKQGVTRLTEVTHYDTDEEILGRVKNALSKFELKDNAGAISVVNRIYKMLLSEFGEVEEEKLLTQAEIRERLLKIIDDLENFRTKDATLKCTELLKCPLPKYVAELINKCVVLLGNYDDEEAENLLKKLVEQYR